MPAVLIEDDCRSIGGKWQMCITHVSGDVRDKIVAYKVPEFRGIDRLDDDLVVLFERKQR